MMKMSCFRFLRRYCRGIAVAVGLFSGSAPAIAADLVYAVDFNDPVVRAAVARCPYAKVEKDFEGTDVLTIRVPAGKQEESFQSAVSIPLSIAAMKLGNGGLFAEGDIQFTNVSEPKFSWNGVKFMLVYSSGGKTEYPDLNPGWKRNCGTRPWYTAGTALSLPADVTKATLVLGLQQSSGEVSFRNIRFYRANAAPKSSLAQQPIPQARYTGDRTIRRGVMSPNRFREEDFADLAKWNANLIRWQLNRDLGREYTLEDYKVETARKIEELAKALDAAAKYNIKIVVDLHPCEGGKLILGSREGHEYLVEVWQSIAKRFKGHPALWGYDILNEPHSRNLKPGFPSWPELAERTIRAIRAVDPDIPVIIEADRMAHYQDLEFLPVFNEPNIIYSIHFYAPGQLTHQLRPNQRPFQGYPDDAKGWNKEYLRRELAKAREFQLKTGARIYVGEFSCIRWAPGAADYIRDLIDLFEEYGWDWTYHAFREWDGWSVEHSDDPDVKNTVPTTRRKEVLLEAFRKNGVPAAETK